MDKKQNLLLDWVKEKHAGQKRKYTGEPYWEHCLSVGFHALNEGVTLGYEIGLCHDLLEDTDCVAMDIYNKLLDIGYSKSDTEKILRCVIDLTDVYTKKCYPHLNRRTRKMYEARRLWKIDPVSQSVKYCDLMDNTKSICKHDPNFAKTYLREKLDILQGMDKGKESLFRECINLVYTLKDCSYSSLIRHENK